MLAILPCEHKRKCLAARQLYTTCTSCRVVCLCVCVFCAASSMLLLMCVELFRFALSLGFSSFHFSIFLLLFGIRFAFMLMISILYEKHLLNKFKTQVNHKTEIHFVELFSLLYSACREWEMCSIFRFFFLC